MAETMELADTTKAKASAMAMVHDAIPTRGRFRRKRFRYLESLHALVRERLKLIH